ncbi:hypothetical protein BC937DRAFT_93121 [Endogone sp. FLAS-F59071]|nr:hypothetical protein BC937DRAFT_93121 [Endogone sp. FLAS-F59071]|eukprot:RUS14946.1 hypothetical protein BC937DRAFT_93121 [Endogone sp. FLAS-F59071]
MLRTFESIIEDYLNNTTYTEWSILSILKHMESKEKIYVDDVGSLKDAIYTMFRHYKSRKNIQQRVNGKLGKLLDNYDVSFGTPKVKRFLNDLRIREEEDDLQVSVRRNMTATYTVEALKDHRRNKKVQKKLQSQDMASRNVLHNKIITSN